MLIYPQLCLHLYYTSSWRHFIGKKSNLMNCIIRSLWFEKKGRKENNLIEIWIMEYFKKYVQIDCYFNWSVNYINETRGIRNYILIGLYYNIYHMDILSLGHLLNKVKGMHNFFSPWLLKRNYYLYITHENSEKVIFIQ